MAATQDMEMQVENRLPSVSSRVGNKTKTGFRKSFVLRHSCAGQQQPSKQRLVGFTQVLHRLHMSLGNDQAMNRSLLVDIVKRQGMLVLIHNLGRDTAFDDPTEDTGAHTSFLLLLLRPESGFAEPFAQFLVNLLERHIVIAQDHQRVEKQIGDFVDNLILLAGF